MVGIIVQARMGSTRLPGKVLKKIGKIPLLQHIINRLEYSKSGGKVVVATSTLSRDDEIEEFCRRNRTDVFRGSELNVLSRYFECSKKYNFDYIVRMTADNPFPDIEEMDKLIDTHIQNRNEFSENYSVLPIGVGMEIMNFNVLQDSMQFASLPKHFEHTDEYVLDNLDDYKHETVSCTEDKCQPDVRLTVDTYEDYQKACYIINNSSNKIVTTQEAIMLSNKYEKGCLQ